MQRPHIHNWLMIPAAMVMCCAACDSKSDSAGVTAGGGGPKPTLTLLADGFDDWSRDEAARHLADKKLALSAAVRLVQLAQIDALCVPESLSDDHVEKLRLIRLGEDEFACGISDRKDELCLHAAVLISNGGVVKRLADGVDEEVLVLHIAEDPEVFPHVAMLPDLVMLVDDELLPAIALEPNQPVMFDLRRQDGFPYVALVLLLPVEDDEVARFIWDPWEEVFTGPAIDRLPDPPGGRFHVDLEESGALEPVGGEIPEPDPIEPNVPMPKHQYEPV